MAQRVQVILVDDVDGGEATESVTFALDGVTYEIDLSEKNAARLRDSMSEWVANARRAGGRKVTGRRAGSTRRDDLNEIRQWGRANGFKVSDRGRVSRELQQAYDTAQGK
ncbi:histone-like nucleoid-structuring protein Lsr2 [Mobilicoccus caccae]|uniref:Lsr2 family protein n=1 Tax=Mobilicoccus caccae TaxID=1859295 RepID=A0ABQ6ILZ0_9MICO|nr:Lsr2 family protein [Mobilicoccus caccae]GMA38370.1 Lsr2 family protein [Mobilicoccus caccae]